MAALAVARDLEMTAATAAMEVRAAKGAMAKAERSTHCESI